MEELVDKLLAETIPIKLRTIHQPQLQELEVLSEVRVFQLEVQAMKISFTPITTIWINLLKTMSSLDKKLKMMKIQKLNSKI
jgi:hypothetical protein